ncbi:7157_t:CDS:1, partial [Gigaspora margarita]
LTLDITPSTLSTSDTNELILLLREQVQQQAQIINLLQTQLQASVQRTQTFVTLQNRVQTLENFHVQMKNLYTQSLVQENPDEPV